MRKPFIAGNWKMNPGIDAGLILIRDLKNSLSEYNDLEIVVIPPFTHLYPVKKEIDGSNIKLGAQDMHWEERGAFTGEISPLMLGEIGCSYVIIGHSERRKYFCERDEIVNLKAKSALNHRLHPIICVGETLEEREKGLTLKVVERQLKVAIDGFNEEDMMKSVIAYEPIWAIGTGINATPEQAEEVHSSIRNIIGEIYGIEDSNYVIIIYGGSVTMENSYSLLKMDNVDGFLVGGASLKGESFTEIVKNSLKAWIDKGGKNC